VWKVIGFDPQLLTGVWKVIGFDPQLLTGVWKVIGFDPQLLTGVWKVIDPQLQDFKIGIYYFSANKVKFLKESK
jgi:hypothetical protein